MIAPQTAETPTAQNVYQGIVDTLYVVVILAGITFPGALPGALIAAGLWSLTREPTSLRLVFAAVAMATALVLRSLTFGWLWRIAIARLGSGRLPLTLPGLERSIATEMLLGPALLLILHFTAELRIRTPLGRHAHERRLNVRRSKAMRIDRSRRPAQRPDQGDWSHPPGKIRLGKDESQQFFDLDVSEIGAHIFIPGATDTGKTTTMMRLAGGAVANGYGVVILDGKGVSLARDAASLAQRNNLPFVVVDPDAETSLGYDPCTGDTPHIANKLVGAFDYSEQAEIYKQVAMEVIPVIARALMASGEKVSLRRIYDTLGKSGLARLSRTPGLPGAMVERLKSLDASGGVGPAGYAGLQHRFGALLEGKFGPLIEREPALDWTQVTESPTVAYFSLSATAASEDVELFVRVITQDLKQLCDARLRTINAGGDVTPLLVVYDEFAAFKEARQIVDLLLQARQARMSVVVATQFIPEDIPIRTPILSAGVMISHRVGDADAKAIAAEFGTHSVPRLTSQVDFETGTSEKGSVREVEEFNVHPNVLRQLPKGVAVVYARSSNRRQVVKVHRDES